MFYFFKSFSCMSSFFSKVWETRMLRGWYQFKKDVLCFSFTLQSSLTQVWSLGGRVSLAGIGRSWCAVCRAGLHWMSWWYWCSRGPGSGSGHAPYWCWICPLWNIWTIMNTGRIAFILIDILTWREIINTLNICIISVDMMFSYLLN